MDRLKEVGRTIQKNKKTTELNTRRVSTNLPLIERKLDAIAGDQPYYMEFPVSDKDHIITLNLLIRPDNCCDCSPGASTGIRDVIAYWKEGSFGVPDNEFHTAIYTRPLTQTGTNFNYGYSSPFFYHIYQQFPEIGGYDIDAEGELIIPVDGMYSILFKVGIDIQNINDDSEITTAINQNGEIISKKTYSSGKRNLLQGVHTYYQYAACVPLHKDDLVAGALSGKAVSWSIGYRDIGNTTRINLLGLGFGTLIGFVKDEITGEPILNATISYTNGFGGKTVTDDTGAYMFEELRPGPYSITATKTGYITMTRDVPILFDEVAEIDFALKETV